MATIAAPIQQSEIALPAPEPGVLASCLAPAGCYRSQQRRHLARIVKVQGPSIQIRSPPNPEAKG
ncbi:hypothetical protein Dda_4660 [Drechslerella dactyloides]|uniref:Uncharacterized protein n=1 Tax=Drechslerella dactyloides TaxID=74499 RepID=A0AAD6IYQ1_DREDA|nr:hypothetical protein Dda_4660 [Drechslerella dactyloides]